ncbi:MAG: PstS family phosphate ABC transporter substrate-binding protein [Fimbriimonadaceae bacterium]|nr:PstS family phosphate ABC transporter substrate-binding protein [Fimbriimonadaceae bacterium]
MRTIWITLAMSLTTGLVLTSCTPSTDGDTTPTTTSDSTESGANASAGTMPSGLTGEIKIDGSSTVYPVMEALVDPNGEFGKANTGLQIVVGSSGTGAGMEKFARGESDIATASRPIKDSEIEALKAANIEFVEIPVAFDGLTVVVNKENTWVKQMTVDQLKAVWNKDSKIANWKEIDPSFPDMKLGLYGPTDAHGTYEFFNETINGDADNTRPDYQATADYSTMVPGIEGDKGAMGYLGLAYFEQNKDKMMAVPIVAPDGTPVTPSLDTVRNGTYLPLSRPLILYVNKKSLDKPEVKAFLMYVLKMGGPMVQETGYVPLPDAVAATAWDRVEKGLIGSVLKNFKPGDSMEDAMAMESN